LILSLLLLNYSFKFRNLLFELCLRETNVFAYSSFKYKINCLNLDEIYSQINNIQISVKTIE